MSSNRNGSAVLDGLRNGRTVSITSYGGTGVPVTPHTLEDGRLARRRHPVTLPVSDRPSSIFGGSVLDASFTASGSVRAWPTVTISQARDGAATSQTDLHHESGRRIVPVISGRPGGGQPSLEEARCHDTKSMSSSARSASPSSPSPRHWPTTSSPTSSETRGGPQ